MGDGVGPSIGKPGSKPSVKPVSGSGEKPGAGMGVSPDTGHDVMPDVGPGVGRSVNPGTGSGQKLGEQAGDDGPGQRPRTARYDEKLNAVLSASSALFAGKGYGRASIRDVSKATGMSLAGLYYYFSSKEELLYLIQYRAFESICEKLRRIIKREADPKACLHAMIKMHFDYFIRHMNDLKICSREIDSLEGEFYREVAEKRKEYFDLTQSIFERMNHTSGEEKADSRLAALYLFGTLNWIYQWYRPGRYPDASEMANQLSGIYLEGFPRAAK